MGSLGFEPRFTALEAVVIPDYTMTPCAVGTYNLKFQRVLNRTSLGVPRSAFNGQISGESMRPWIGLSVLLLLFASNSFALQAVDAEGIIQQGNYLEQNERAAVYKGLPQVSGSPKYWLVSVTQNDALKTVIPIGDRDSKIIAKGNLRTELISANVLVQRLALVKGSTQWMVSLTTANKLEELANALENESFDVDIVLDGIPESNTTLLRSNISTLKSRLSEMSSLLKNAGSEIRSLVQIETQLLNVEIDTLPALGLEDEYVSIYDKVNAVKEKASVYDGAVGQYKNSIAQLDSLTAEEKAQLIGLLSPLGNNQSITSAITPYASIASDNEQRITTEFASLNAKVSNFDAELEKRLQRAEAFASIYLENSNLRTQTGYATLEQAVNTILAEQNKSQWKNQTEVTRLNTTWTQILDRFKKAQYVTVLELVPKAIASVKTIKRDGALPFVDETPDLSSAIITFLAAILGVFAIILIAKNVINKMNAQKEEEN